MKHSVIVRDTMRAGRSMFALVDFSAGEVVSQRAVEEDHHAICLLADRVLTDGAAVARRLISLFPSASTSPLARTPVIEGFLRARIPEHPDVPIVALLRAVICLNLKTPNPDGVYGIFPTLSYVNHGCMHNAVLASSPRTSPEVLRLLAVRPIAAGQEITVGYLMVVSDGKVEPLGVTLPSLDVRRRFVREEYGFKCQCAFCTGACTCPPRHPPPPPPPTAASW